MRKNTYEENKEISINDLEKRLKQSEGKMLVIEISNCIKTVLFLEDFEYWGVDKLDILTLYSNEDESRFDIDINYISKIIEVENYEGYNDSILVLNNDIDVRIYNS